jgi:predicted dienelactone hydrolase
MFTYATIRCAALICVMSGICHAEAGGWDVGFANLALSDPIAGGPMKGIVTYPTRARTRSLRIGPYFLDVAENAPPADGAFPLIILSPGKTGSPENYNDFFTALSQSGYVVAGVAHPGDNRDDRSGTNGDAELVWRTRHIVALIDALLTEPRLAAHIDPRRIGMIGHSAGAYTALLLVGARPDFSQLQGRCRGNPNRPIDAPRVIHDPSQEPVSDLRIRAAVIMAPAWGCFFDREGLKDVTAVLRFYHADADEVLYRKYDGEYIASELAQRPEFAVLAGAGHFVFLSACPFIMRLFAPREVCVDPNGVDRVALHARMHAEITQFFADRLGK